MNHNSLEQPSRLKSQDNLILHTLSAQHLYHGTKKGPVGLHKFSGLMLRVWQAAAQDDPYADQCLLDVYNLLIKATRQLQKMEANYRKKLIARDGVEFEPALAESPIKLPLHFTTPYGHLGVYVLADYDRCCRVIVTAKYAALVTPQEANDDLRKLRKEIRRAFSRPLQWQYTGVTRQDIAAQNDKAQQAKQKMGDLNHEVLTGQLRSPFSPEIFPNKK